MQDKVIITKTVENEAKNALDNAVNSTLRVSYLKTLRARYKYMVLQHLVLNDSLDRLDYYVEECSIRLPIDVSERNKIKDEEIEPFLKELVKKTLRYLQPRRVPRRVVKSKALREELKQIMYDSLPSKGIIYKGMPGDRDLIIMAEATLIKRTKSEDELFYIASVDNHYKPNPVQVGSFLSKSMTFTGELDGYVRDQLSEKFGFIGEDPEKIIALIKKIL